MPRCLVSAALALSLAWPVLASAQAHRPIPIPIPLHSLRGEVVFGQPPDITLNGQPARLAPGSRIKSTQNLLVMASALVGQKGQVNYTFDLYGMLLDVWLLSEVDLAKPWPQTREQAATWSYDPVTQTWIKP